MTRIVVLNGEPLTVDAVHRLALAVVPIDAMTRAAVGARALVGREPRSGRLPLRRHRAVLDPVARRFDIAFENTGSPASKLRHRLDLPSPPNGEAPPPLTEEMVARVSDPSRRYVSRRLIVPVWTRHAVELADEEPPGPYVPIRSRVVRLWLHPGSAYQPAPGTTGVRGAVRRAGVEVAWARIEAVDPGPPAAVLARAHADDRGEFLLLVSTAGSLPQPGNIELAFWAPPVDAVEDEDVTHDPLHGLAIEDAVDRTPGAPDGAVDGRVLRGEAIPPSYGSLGPRRVVPMSIGSVIHPAPFVFG